MKTSHTMVQHPRTEQKLALTTQVQKGLHLLQLPTHELISFIEMEITNNPLLEFSEEITPSEEIDESFQYEDQELDFSQDDFALLTHLDEEYDDFFFQKELFQDPYIAKPPYEEQFPSHDTLYEHLKKQLLEKWDEYSPQYIIAEQLIGYISPQGFFDDSITTMAQENHWNPHTVAQIIATIQQLDPPGIGARTLQESLLIQLQRQGKKNHPRLYNPTTPL